MHSVWHKYTTLIVNYEMGNVVGACGSASLRVRVYLIENLWRTH